jgi:hypothetical protein
VKRKLFLSTDKNEKSAFTLAHDKRSIRRKFQSLLKWRMFMKQHFVLFRFPLGGKRNAKVFQNSPVCVDESKNVLVVSTSRNKVEENNSFLI